MLVTPVNNLVASNKDKIAKLFVIFPEFPLDTNGLEKIGLERSVAEILEKFESGFYRENEAAELLTELCSTQNFSYNQYLQNNSDI